jgi:NUMOD4 motif
MRERESWRKVRRADGYKVSSLGRVRSPGGLLTPYPDRDGYLRIKIRGEQVQVSHLVLEAFCGPRPYGTEACHGPNGVRDNRVSELRWDTRRENGKDKKRHEMRETEGGTYPSWPATLSQGVQQ